MIVFFDVNDSSFDDTLKSSKLKIVVPEGQRLETYSNRAYLVESSKEDLFSIKKILDANDDDGIAHFTKNFGVFKLV